MKRREFIRLVGGAAVSWPRGGVGAAVGKVADDRVTRLQHACRREPTRCRFHATAASTRLDRWPHCHHRASRPGDVHDPDRLRRSGRPRWKRTRRQSGATGRQCHRPIALADRNRRQTAGALARGGSRAPSFGDHGQFQQPADRAGIGRGQRNDQQDRPRTRFARYPASGGYRSRPFSIRANTSKREPCYPMDRTSRTCSVAQPTMSTRFYAGRNRANSRSSSRPCSISPST